VSIEIPLTLVMRASVLLPRRWLVCQTKTDGTLVYAQAFARRASAEKARQAADDRRTAFLSTRNRAYVARLPFDRR
jgi:hypothetical protein